jgi:hypothetical protein
MTMTPTEAPERRITCRYLRRSGDQCTGQVTDSNAEILLCQKHLARAIELVRAGMRRTGITTPPPARRTR